MPKVRIESVNLPIGFFWRDSGAKLQEEVEEVDVMDTADKEVDLYVDLEDPFFPVEKEASPAQVSVAQAVVSACSDKTLNICHSPPHLLSLPKK